VRQIFLILALFCASFAFNAPYQVLGPNIEYGIFAAAAPAGFKESFVPQANANFDFFWLEPLSADRYGTLISNKTNYIRFLAGAEVSPFYGTVRAGFGFAPLPPPFAVLELRFIYSNENIWCDVEMPMEPGDEDLPSIKESWNAGYMFNRFYNRSSYSQIQSFDMQLSGKYVSQNFDISFLLGYALIDINSNYDKKSFDYMRGIPLYSRDYVITEELSAGYRFGKYFSWNMDFFSFFSGKQPGISKTYDKEPLSHYMLLTGPSWRFNKDRSFLYLNAGLFNRDNSNDNFNDPIKENILLSIQYKHYWDFRFGKE
jgi:hypothetical protein